MLRDERLNTLFFFVISIIIVLLCFMTFLITRRSEFVKFYITVCENAAVCEDQQAITITSNNEEVGLVSSRIVSVCYWSLNIVNSTSFDMD